MTAVRLDVSLTDRGLARSRARAAELIARGAVRVNGQVSTKPSLKVGEGDTVAVEADDWVSRSAPKLDAALARFGVDVVGRRALDIGACTGGFTQVLLARGAASVVALDVGHDQLAPELADDARVTNLEGVNARDLTVDAVGGPVSLVVSDVSFISLTYVVPRVPGVLDGADADLVLLVKPQFEVGRERLGRGGVVVDPQARHDAVRGVVTVAEDHGLRLCGVAPASVLGQHGNQEFVVWLQPGGGRAPQVALPGVDDTLWRPTPRGEEKA